MLPSLKINSTVLQVTLELLFRLTSLRSTRSCTTRSTSQSFSKCLCPIRSMWQASGLALKKGWNLSIVTSTSVSRRLLLSLMYFMPYDSWLTVKLVEWLGSKSKRATGTLEAKRRKKACAKSSSMSLISTKLNVCPARGSLARLHHWEFWVSISSVLLRLANFPLRSQTLSSRLQT